MSDALLCTLRMMNGKRRCLRKSFLMRGRSKTLPLPKIALCSFPGGVTTTMIVVLMLIAETKKTERKFKSCESYGFEPSPLLEIFNSLK